MAPDRAPGPSPRPVDPAPSGPEPVAIDLTPRTGSRPGPRRPGRTVRLAVLGGLLAVAAGFLLWRGLDDAALYYRNADEAVAQRAQLADRRFRLQGRVVPGTVTETPTGVAFTVEHNGATVDVHHTGDPPQLFAEGIRVVVEGRFDGDVFVSDRILVKHSESYEAEHPDRVDGGATPVTGP